MKLQSHNLSITPEVIHYDNKGNKIKTMSFPQESIAGEDSNIELTLYESDGTIKDVFICPFRSFTHNFARVIMSRSYIAPGSNINVINTGGALQTVVSTNLIFGYLSPTPVNISTWGIMVGASGSAVATSSIMSNALTGLITHGTAVGQLSYSVQTYDTGLTEVSGSYMFSMLRTFTNNSAGNVNIKEVGWAGNTWASSHKVLYTRDVKDSNGNDINVTVAPTQVLTVRYNIFAPKASGMHRNLLAYILSEIRATTVLTSLNLVDRDGFENTVSGFTVNGIYYMHFNAGVGINWNGVMVGKGEATESLDIIGPDVQWVTHGSSSADQLIYGANETDGANIIFSTSGSSVEWIVKRTFTNGFADPITVKEAILVASPDSTYNNNSKITGTKYIYARKLIGDNVINSGSTLEVQFKFMIEA